jgi:S1-C subfamily serine protease
VIGVTAQIQSESGGNDGVGFAIPSNTVESIVAQLLASGSVEHAYLGVSVAEIPASAASDLGTATGVEITEIRDDAPAAAAGLRAASGSETVDGQSYPTGGDVITAVDGEAVTTSAELQRAIDAKHPGDSVSITYTRDGQSETVDVTLGTRPS